MNVSNVQQSDIRLAQQCLAYHEVSKDQWKQDLKQYPGIAHLNMPAMWQCDDFWRYVEPANYLNGYNKPKNVSDLQFYGETIYKRDPNEYNQTNKAVDDIKAQTQYFPWTGLKQIKTEPFLNYPQPVQGDWYKASI